VEVSDKRGLKHKLGQVQKVATWQLVVLLVFAVFLSATFLRLNNIGMVERREAVIAADEAGVEEVIQDRLYDLQRYVSSHMNTDLGGGVSLQHSYERDYEAAYERASANNNSSRNVYESVQETCAPRFSSWSQAYVQCVSSELAKYPSGEELASSVKEPNPELYVHDFSSPRWSSDFAGWSVLLTVVIFVMILIRITSVIILKQMLSKHHRGI
jgi:hypothetical protein